MVNCHHRTVYRLQRDNRTCGRDADLSNSPETDRVARSRQEHHWHHLKWHVGAEVDSIQGSDPALTCRRALIDKSPYGMAASLPPSGLTGWSDSQRRRGQSDPSNHRPTRLAPIRTTHLAVRCWPTRDVACRIVVRRYPTTATTSVHVPWVDPQVSAAECRTDASSRAPVALAFHTIRNQRQ